MNKILILFICLNAFGALSQFNLSKEIESYLKIKRSTLFFDDTVKILDSDILVSKVERNMNVFIPQNISSIQDYGSISGFFYKHQNFLTFICLDKINLKNKIDNQLVSLSIFDSDLKSCYIFQVLNGQVLCYSLFKYNGRNWSVNDYYIQQSGAIISGLSIEHFINDLNQST